MNLVTLAEPIERVQRPYGEFGIGGVDQYRKLDFGGGDGADVDVAGGKRCKRFRGDAGMAAIAAADQRDFCDMGAAVEPRVTDSALRTGDSVAGADIIRGRHGEGEVGGGAVLRDVLDRKSVV